MNKIWEWLRDYGLILAMILISLGGITAAALGTAHNRQHTKDILRCLKNNPAAATEVEKCTFQASPDAWDLCREIAYEDYCEKGLR